jgi:hypothetical protein
MADQHVIWVTNRSQGKTKNPALVELIHELFKDNPLKLKQIVASHRQPPRPTTPTEEDNNYDDMPELEPA